MIQQVTVKKRFLMADATVTFVLRLKLLDERHRDLCSRLGWFVDAKSYALVVRVASISMSGWQSIDHTGLFELGALLGRLRALQQAYQDLARCHP